MKKIFYFLKCFRDHFVITGRRNMSMFRYDVISGKVCPYCNRKSELTDSSEVYMGTSFGYIYICRLCNAYVGCHKGSKESLGRLADKSLRLLKHCAHDIFDIIWKDGYKKRYEAYQWLGDRMNLSKQYMHLGMLDVDDCMNVIRFCRNYLLFKDYTKYKPIIDSKLKNYKIKITTVQ